jgi:hypothetical protein
MATDGREREQVWRQWRQVKDDRDRSAMLDDSDFDPSLIDMRGPHPVGQ